jgi:2-phosphosulfolactate phosphatase
VDFDLGNSPREYTAARVRGRRIVTTTTNGTRAFAATRTARFLMACSFLNLTATARQLTRLNCARILLVCAGTGEDAAFEDILGAGALCRKLVEANPKLLLADSALRAHEIFSGSEADLEGAMARSSNAQRLLTIPELREDVTFCLTENLFPIVVLADASGSLHRVGAEQI